LVPCCNMTCIWPFAASYSGKIQIPLHTEPDCPIHPPATWLHTFIQYSHLVLGRKQAHFFLNLPLSSASLSEQGVFVSVAAWSPMLSMQDLVSVHAVSFSLQGRPPILPYYLLLMPAQSTILTVPFFNLFQTLCLSLSVGPYCCWRKFYMMSNSIAHIGSKRHVCLWNGMPRSAASSCFHCHVHGADSRNVSVTNIPKSFSSILSSSCWHIV
jgi:hypothetical protein